MGENPFRVESFRNLPEEALEETYRNPHVELPFDPKDLGMFLDRKGGAVNLRALDYHHRSADLGVNTIIHEREGNRHQVYCQFDLKGSGFQFPETYESKKSSIPRGMMANTPEAYMITGSQETPWGYEPLGLMDERSVQFTIEIAERLSVAGMRTEGIAAVYRLRRLVYDGKEMGTDEFKKINIERIVQMARETKDPEGRKELIAMAKDLKWNFEPVLMVRLLRSIFRIRDLNEEPEKKEAMIEEACQSLNNEAQGLGSTERYDSKTPEGREKWLKRIVRELGKNAGILHQQGLVHMFMHMGNLTLAGEIVDLDSVDTVAAERVFRGKPENKQVWLDKGDDSGPYRARPFFKETATGCTFISPTIGLHQKPDARFGLPRCVTKDIRDLCFSVRGLTKSLRSNLLGKKLDTRDLAKELSRGYLEGLAGKTPLEALGVTPERLAEVFSEVARDVVERGNHYPPIPGDDEDV